MPVVLKLKRAEVATADFIVRTSGGKKFTESFENAIHYQGVIDRKPASLAALSFTSKEISGVFSFGTGNYNLVKMKSLEKGKPVYALFNDTDILRKNPFACHTDDLTGNKSPFKSPAPKSTQEIQVDNCRRVELYFECDHQLFLDNGSSVGQTVNFVTSLFNVVSAIYAQTGVVTRISETMVHTQPDNYPTGSSADALSAFDDSVSIRPPFNGDLAHLLSTVPSANGGRAYLDVLCSKGTGYSNIYPSFLPLPFYSWDVNVVTHELGHNFGSPHTQSCSWEISPGNYAMIDSCYFSEGGCYSGPRIATRGTQMSYCHLMNLGIDMSKGFGPLPGELIHTNYLNSSCLNGSVDLPALFITKPDSFCSSTNVGLNVTQVAGATYAWTGPNGFTSNVYNPVLTNISPSQAGIYSATVSKGGCSSATQTTKVSVNCINAIPQTNRTLCLPGVFSVDFIANIQPNAGNVYTVQLSNASGSFSSPTAIGYLTSTQMKGTISVSLPNGFQADSGFLVRIISSNPASIGQAEPQKLKFIALSAEPQAVDITRCQAGSFALSATASGQILWYSSANSATPLATGNTFNTPNLSSTTSYWVGSQHVKKEQIGPVLDLNSPDILMVNNTYHGLFVRVKKTLIIDSITVSPNGPGVLHFNLKDSANTFIYKSIHVPLLGNVEGEKVKIGLEISPGIYRVDAESSTVPGLLRLNNYFDYPLISEGMEILGASVPSRYYFFFDWKIRSFGCPGKRKEVKAIISTPPNPPTVQGANRCGQGTVTLQASGATAGQSYLWYTLASGGTTITGQTGASYITPVISSNTTYYVSIYASSTCESSRIPVVATINTVPNPPTTTGASHCGPATINLGASGATAGQSYVWYTVASGGTPISGTTVSGYTTPNLTATTTYYAAILGAGNCESTRQAVSAVILSVPPTPTLTLSNGYLVASIDTVYEWYKNNGLLGVFGDSLNYSLFGDGSYYAILKRANTCSAQSNTILVTQQLESINELKNIRIYPNPGNGLFTLETSVQGEWQYQIFDGLGRKVDENSTVESGKQIDLRTFASGIYTLKIQGSGIQEVIRLRKE